MHSLAVAVVVLTCYGFFLFALAGLLVYFSVAEINTALVDDGLVDKAKIGGSNYFWSFPAKKDRLMQVEHQERLKRIDMLQKQLQEVTGKLADAKRGREDCDGDRASKLQRLADIAKEKGKLQVEYEQLKENDPQAMADLHQELQFCMQAANRWTDNIFQCKAFLVKKRGMDKKQAEKLLGITGDFDCKCERFVFLVTFSVTRTSHPIRIRKHAHISIYILVS